MKKTSTNTPPPHPGLDRKVQHAKLEPENSVAGNGKPESAPRIPYRSPELIAAPVTATTYLCGSEKDADALAKIGFVATTASEGAGAAWEPALSPWFKDRPVVILPAADRPGRAHGQKVARALHGVAASVKLVDLFPDRTDGSDVSDFLANDRAGSRLAQLVKGADEWEPPPSDASAGDRSRAGDGKSDDELISELAALSKLAYEKRREKAAERLGVRVSALDQIVAKARGETKGPGDKVLYAHWNVEPSEEPVEGDALLAALVETIRRYVFLSEDQAVAVALWIIFSWLHEREAFATHSPILFVTSAEKDSGKSTLLGVVNFLARRSLQSVDITGAALFRSIAKWQPTLIVDEADDALSDNVDLRSVINSGWTRGQGVIRCHPDTHEPELFSTFAPKVVGMKGRNLPDTTLSRSIVITMKPRRLNDPTEATEDFNHCDNEAFGGLRSQLMRWSSDNADALAKAEPTIPPAFHNRRRANWVPLLAIAEAAGGGWKKAGEKAALAIEAIADTFEPSLGVQLLEAIRGVFQARGQDRISSADMIAELVADEIGPWATYNKGKPIAQRQVASLLKPFGIKPRAVRLADGSNKKGYILAWFNDAFTRFCSSDTHPSAQTPDSVRHSVTDLFSQDNSAISSVTSHSGVTDEITSNPLENYNCDAVTGRKGGFGDESVCERSATQKTHSEPYENCIADDTSSGLQDDAGPSQDGGGQNEARTVGANENRSCRQCDGPIDGTEQSYVIDGDWIWLHPECHAHRLRNRGDGPPSW